MCSTLQFSFGFVNQLSTVTKTSYTREKISKCQREDRLKLGQCFKDISTRVALLIFSDGSADFAAG